MKLSRLFCRLTLLLLLVGSLLGCASRATTHLLGERIHSARVEEPHAVLGPGGQVLVVWGEVAPDGAADVFFASVREGLAEMRPVRVNSRRGTAVAGRQVGPRMAVTSGGRIFVTWVDRQRDPSGDILLSVSDDGGLTFSPAICVNDDPGLAGQEYQDITVLTDGTVALSWLDERDAADDNKNQKQLYFVSSTDGGRSFGPNLALTSSPQGVCPCCRPGLVAFPSGSLHVVYRDRVEVEPGKVQLVIRMASRLPADLAFRSPVTVSRKGWAYEACPVDGPAVLAEAGGTLRVVWMDASPGRETIWQALSQDAGRTFGPPVGLTGPSTLNKSAAEVACLRFTRAAEPCCLARDSGDQELDSAVPGRAVLARHPLHGTIAAWQDDAGGVWLRGLDEKGAALRFRCGGERRVCSPQMVVADDAIHLFWTEVEWNPAVGLEEPHLVSRLGHARLKVERGELTMVQTEVSSY